MHHVIKNAEKRHFSDAPLPLSAKSLLRNSVNHPLPILLRDGDHEPPIQILPYLRPWIVTTEGQIHPPGMEADPGGHVHQILHHRAQTPSLRLLPMGRPFLQIAVVFPETLLPAKPEQIVGRQGQGHDVGIGGKMFARQSLQIHIRLDLRMKLLAGPVISVQQNDLIGIVLKRSPVRIHFHLRNQQTLTVLRRPLRHLENNPQGHGKTFYGAMHLPAPNGLSLAGGGFLSFFLRNLQPLLDIFPTEISLHQPIGSFLDADGDVVQHEAESSAGELPVSGHSSGLGTSAGNPRDVDSIEPGSARVREERSADSGEDVGIRWQMPRRESMGFTFTFTQDPMCMPGPEYTPDPFFDDPMAPTW